MNPEASKTIASNTIASNTIAAWSAQPDISARSLLVTIFGDTVLPVTTSFLLAQLFALTDVFGFSQRLVRTSMYRLTTEAWFTSQREGRQSRYSATALAIGESEHASHRIYGGAENNWHDTDWTLVMLDPALDGSARSAAVHDLNRSGFLQLGQDILGSPTVTASDVANIWDKPPSSPEPVRAVLTGRFSDLDALLADGFFTQGFDTEAIELTYKEILQRYEAMSNADIDELSGLEAFAFRTMLVHDLRRIKLRFPELPASLTTPDWAGHQAHVLACRLYPILSAKAAPALSGVLETEYPAGFANRFVS